MNAQYKKQEQFFEDEEEYIDLEQEPVYVQPEEDSTVSAEEANAYLENVSQTSTQMGASVALCICSAIPLILMGGLFDHTAMEDKMGLLGLMGTVVMVAIAVYNFIQIGAKNKPFEYLKKEEIKVSSPVKKAIQKMKQNYTSKHTSNISTGVVLCILSALPLFAFLILGMENLLPVALCMTIATVAYAIYQFVKTNSIMNGYKVLLQEEDFTIEAKQENSALEVIEDQFWSITLILYLGYSFLSGNWGKSWIIWPMAVVISMFLDTILKMIGKKKK
ncbi:MAG: hypothetical protein KBT48_03630 [Firmicutes bacterium]|nr:hypothetical protein [Bacillota bacterium]